MHTLFESRGIMSMAGGQTLQRGGARQMWRVVLTWSWYPVQKDRTGI